MLKTYKCMVNLYVLFTQRAKETRDEGDDEVQAEVNFLWLLFYKSQGHKFISAFALSSDTLYK